VYQWDFLLAWRCSILPSSKRIIITIPESLLGEVDNIKYIECKNRSEIFREAIRFYLGERKKKLLIEQMKKGYLEMAEINLNIACENSGVEEEALSNCIEKLLE
jgi:CopG family transcriptional regulator/antitoxin EndoAI